MTELDERVREGILAVRATGRTNMFDIPVVQRIAMELGYVGAYQENGVTLIASVMGDKWRNMAWTDLRRLFAYGMKTVEDKE